MFYKQTESYHNKSRYFSHVNTFWVIQNNQPVLKAIDKINQKTNAKSVVTYDFSTLYTKIPHNKLLDVLEEVIDFCFKGRTLDYLGISNSGEAKWYKKRPKTFFFTKTSIKEAIKFLIENCYFTLGSYVLRQIIGIPMGSDPAPFFANLFLFHYEYRWIKKQSKENPSLVRLFNNIFRYIDDLIALNNNNEFDKHYKEIYPPELELKKENIDPTEASFLDLSIKIRESRFCTSLYDKRNNFSFSIVRMPNQCSNIPTKMFYSTISSEILRICRATSSLELFLISTKTILLRMFNQGANYSKLKISLLKMLNKHSTEFSKYNVTNDILVTIIMNTSNNNRQGVRNL